jgi:hypothetical protein
MKKREYITRYGKSAYEKMMGQNREWVKGNRRRVREAHRDRNRKVGKDYGMRLNYQLTGLSGEKHKVRVKHGTLYRPFKKIIAPDSRLHHEWHPGSAGYDGVALVEANQHMHGVIDVIRILEGNITLFTEQAIRER